ncbi:MAG: ATP-binding protein, partial [Pseudomonadota bacterium]
MRKALRDILIKLDQYTEFKEVLDTVELVLAEVLNNVVEHAYAEINPGFINLNLAVEPDGLHVEVVDVGAPMPNGEPPMGCAPDPEVELSDMPEGGFGWFLIRDLARDLTYERRDRANHTSFRIALNPDSGAKPTPNAT